ncbi:MAG: formate dehydrogenase accessory sulfurtransferase FdhD [Motiliproteus sp.]
MATKQPVSVTRWRADGIEVTADQLAVETPVALCYNGICHLVMMLSPQDLDDFALGFSITEGIIESPQELHQLDFNSSAEGIEINLSIAARRERGLKQRKRNLTGRTGCGLCGTDSLQQAIRPVNPVISTESPSDVAVQQAVAQLDRHQPLQQLTGAVHGAAWCNLEGEILCIREDVGRHNALDKLIGALLCAEVDLSEGFVLISSRASYEMVHKVAAVGIANLVAVSAPTALAIKLAKEAGVNVIAFAREGSHVRYT